MAKPVCCFVVGCLWLLKCLELFLKCGFVRIVSESAETAQCVLYVQVLSAESMKQSKFKRHL